MKKVFLILGILFTVLTFVGAGYVLLNNGQVNAGYAAVPMVFAVMFICLYRNKNNNIKEN